MSWIDDKLDRNIAVLSILGPDLLVGMTFKIRKCWGDHNDPREKRIGCCICGHIGHQIVIDEIDHDYSHPDSDAHMYYARCLCGKRKTKLTVASTEIEWIEDGQL